MRGHGRQKGHREVYRGQEYNVDLLPKVKVEIVVAAERSDEAIRALTGAARTGKIGDGKIFIYDVAEAIRIRNGDRGAQSSVARRCMRAVVLLFENQISIWRCSMGANPTQAQALVLFIVAFSCISAGFAADINFILVGLGVLMLVGSALLFLKCKPWEHNEE